MGDIPRICLTYIRTAFGNLLRTLSWFGFLFNVLSFGNIETASDLIIQLF